MSHSLSALFTKEWPWANHSRPSLLKSDHERIALFQERIALSLTKNGRFAGKNWRANSQPWQTVRASLMYSLWSVFLWFWLHLVNCLDFFPKPPHQIPPPSDPSPHFRPPFPGYTVRPLLPKKHLSLIRAEQTIFSNQYSTQLLST